MNCFNYLMDKSRFSGGDFLLGNKETISFEDLFYRAMLLAYKIRSLYGENKHILLASPNSVFFLVNYLAIIKSGNICVPLNTMIEERNLEYIRKVCQSDIAFIPERLADEKWSKIGKLHHETIGDEVGALGPLHYELFEEEFDQERLAEVIFTSGSTGEPKGVMITHKNIIANTESILEYLALDSSDIIEIVLPFYYCYGLSLLHTHLRVCGSVVFNNNFVFIGSVIKDLKKYKCTGFSGVPSHFQILLRKSKSFKTEKFPDLRYVTQAGGKLHTVFLKEFADSFPGIKFFVMYGQTEATARLSYLDPKLFHEKLGSIGKAIPGVSLKLVDENGTEITRPEVVGELVAKGENIMKGYLDDEQATSESLVNGWLHTKDLAYQDEDGFFYLTARKLEIIKVGGNRVSPKEIEEVIVSIAEVVDCSISGVFDETLGEAIKAKVVVSDPESSQVNPDMIKAYCSRHLALYKIPQIVELVKKLDIAPTGKKVKN